MTATYTARLRATLQGDGDNLDTWGDVLNQQTIQLLEDAIARRVALTVSGAVTLTTNSGATDQARCAFLDCTGTGGTITIPAVEKTYLVRNATSPAADIVVTTGGATTATVKGGNIQFVVTDGAAVYHAQERDLGSDLLSTTADPTSANHLARKAYVDAGDATQAAALTAEASSRASGDASTLATAKSYTDATSFAAGSLPGGGFTGQYLRRIAGPSADWYDPFPQVAGGAYDGLILGAVAGATAWISVKNVALAKSANYTLAAADTGKVLELTSSATLGLVAAAAAGDGFKFYVRNGGAGVWIIDPNGAETIDARAAIVVYPGERFAVIGDGAKWRTVGRARRWLVESAAPSSAAAVNMELAFTANNGAIDPEIETLDYEFDSIAVGGGGSSQGSVSARFKQSGSYLASGYTGAIVNGISIVTLAASGSSGGLLANNGSTTLVFTGKASLLGAAAASSIMVASGYDNAGAPVQGGFRNGSQSAVLQGVQFLNNGGSGSPVISGTIRCYINRSIL